jgi:hypothetical protein
VGNAGSSELPVSGGDWFEGAVAARKAHDGAIQGCHVQLCVRLRGRRTRCGISIVRWHRSSAWAENALLDVVAGEPQGAGCRFVHAVQRGHGVGVELGNGDPLQALAQVVFHPGYEFPGMTAEFEPFAELRRDDELEQWMVADGLDGVQRFGDADPVGGW